METLRKVLGHSTVKLTERYGRLRPWAVAAEARRIGNNLAVTGTVGGTVARAKGVGWQRYGDSNPGLMAENLFAALRSRKGA